ncbi:alpha/beta hydrolase [Methylacidiphilum kamchatkense]|uniref:Lipase (Class 3) n=1 Tax=Methylacidiphilum kamchatkense Kam1 TaxID=1202785 RepID=A0A516TJR7_9BACT|nr:alpha/beta hydrolase [Methylacidiphilum kamchatkense]QDQ41502.1 lipase (class 3) [Methylacidiphilum kamchatkense Kam1]
MKRRAGVIGRTGLFKVIKELGEDSGQLRLHLVGHSMGAIVYTLACKKLAEAGSDFKPASLTLLQGAFTHYGFGKDVNVKGITDGPYRVVVETDAVAGSIAVTFSKYDEALHVLYAIAQRLARDIVRPFFIGDRDDPYGAIGANGAQKTPEAEEIALDTSPKVYTFAKGSVYNLNGKEAIQNHGDVTNEAIAAVLLSAAESC